ncbi:MAG: GNAT family N-acetyltransferase [Polyangiaceae bacterium]
MTEALYDVTPLGADDADDLADLFRASESPCFCRFWHFTGTNNEWLDRCANRTIENERELRAGIAAGAPDAQGVIARVAGARTVVGWAKVAPVTSMKKAYDRRLYRNLPCFAGDREGVFAIGCFLVHPEHRHRGVAEALVRGAIRFAPMWGARALEAFPRRPREPVRDDELWTGPMSAFERNGFVEVHTFDPYPVLRREV